MFHLRNDAFSTVLAFHAPSELLNLCLCLILAFQMSCNCHSNGHVSVQQKRCHLKFRSPKSNLALQGLTLQPCLFAALSLFVLTCLSSCLLAPFALAPWVPFAPVVFVVLWPFGPQSFGPWPFGDLACAPLASGPLVLFALALLPLWPFLLLWPPLA